MAAHDPIPIEEIDYESLPPEFSLLANLSAGAFAGIAEHCVMYPVDNVKTRMQIMSPSPSAVYSSVGNALSRITTTEGFRSLWRGISSVALGAGPAHAVYFVVYEMVKERTGGNVGNAHHPLAAAMGGACATIASDALMTPFDVLKQRLQVHDSPYRSLWQAARTVYRNEGLNAFYVSYPTTLAMTIPFTATQFTAYESISKVLNPSKKYDPITHITAGGLAGAFAAGITTPLDVVKTLLQTRGNSNDKEIRKAKGFWEAATIIQRRHGVGGFFRGVRPRIITTMPSTAICWASYEMGKAYFLGRNQKASS